MEEEIEFIANYGMEKETTVIHKNGSAHKIRIEIMWNNEKSLEGMKLLIKEAKQVLDSMLR